MCLRFHVPLFFSRPYQIKLDNALKEKAQLTRPVEEYKALLDFKRHLSTMVKSIRQLSGISPENDWVEFERQLASLVEKKLNSAPTHIDEIRCKNTFQRIKSELEDNHVFLKANSVCYLVTSSIITLAVGSSALFAGAVIATGPIGLACLGVGLALVSSALLLMSAYNLYVEQRFLAGKQIKEIDNALEQIFSSSDSLPENAATVPDAVEASLQF